MKLNIKELLDFFDDKKDSEKGDANALMAVMGEDLNAAVYKHFRNNKVEILHDESVLAGGKGGKWLDRWVVDKENKKIFQCEIKNWGATALGGKKLSSDANDENTKKVAKHHWGRELNNNFSETKEHPNGVTKALLAMRKPKGYEKYKVESLLIYWMPITSDPNGLNPLSKLPVTYLHSVIKTDFNELTIFSVSLYLRQLYKKGKGKKVVDLDMPHFKHRMDILTRLNKE